MQISLIEVNQKADLEREELRDRLHEGQPIRKITRYRADCDDCEAAFVIIERWPEPDFNHLVLTELFVLPDVRDRGIGTAILEKIECRAATDGFGAVRVRPHSLDATMDQSDLVQWYRKRGYRPVTDMSGDMEKRVDDGSTEKNS